MRYILSILCLLTLSAKAQDSLLSGLKKAHPRLLFSNTDFERVAALKGTDDYIKTAWPKLYTTGEKMLSEPAAKFEIPDGKRLLATSRAAVERVATLGLLYRVTKEKRFAERAWKELEAAAQFPDWNPTHFLDVGEMTFAFALGYDWLFDYWNNDQKKIIRSAIIEKGLSRALLAYDKLATQGTGWWTDVPHNWNQVCNGGIGVGALAIADEEPKLATVILQNVIQKLPLAMKHFAPDGAWNEGPGYWNYATRYNVAIIAALNSALGKDFGLSDIEGFSKTGLFPLYLNSPINRSFNYADGGDGAIKGAQLFWFAKRFNQPEAAQYLYAFKTADPFALLWYDPSLIHTKPTLQTDSYFREAEVVALRSKWNDPNATFVSFKAGDNKANHSHLDLGSFILDAQGERWIIDLGADNYNIPGYFNTAKGGQRWTYYRNRAEGHNTLVIHPSKEEDQDPKAATVITGFNSGMTEANAVMDLSPAYGTSVHRGIYLQKEKEVVVIRDEISNKQAEAVYWFAHTKAKISLDATKRNATLQLNGKKMVATILSPANATFTSMEAKPLPSSPQPAENNPNQGIQKLSVYLPATKETNITIVFHPEGTVAGKAFNEPLQKWKK